MRAYFSADYLVKCRKVQFFWFCFVLLIYLFLFLFFFLAHARLLKKRSPYIMTKWKTSKRNRNKNQKKAYFGAKIQSVKK